MRFLLVLIVAHFARFCIIRINFTALCNTKCNTKCLFFYSASFIYFYRSYSYVSAFAIAHPTIPMTAIAITNADTYFAYKLLSTIIIIVIAKFIIITTLGSTLDVTIPIKHSIKQIIMTTHIACITNPNINAPKNNLEDN